MSNGEVKRIWIKNEDGLVDVFNVRKHVLDYQPDGYDEMTPLGPRYIEVMRVDDHERIVAGLKEELEVFRNREYGLENELELKQTIATQALVIGNLKGALEGILVFADDADMRREFARRALEKLAAIEKVV